MDNNIIVKITGEADLTDAQMQLRETAARGKELTAQMAALSKVEKENEQSIRALSLSEEQLAKRLADNARYYKEQKREIQQAIAANDKNAASLKKAISTYNAFTNAGGKVAQQIKAIRERLMEMEMAGETSSQEFIDLSVQAARLADQMGDTAAQIRILSSDTANLDAAMSLGSGLAGVFNVATSAAALFGGENEKLQQAFLKVQAALAILNGVQSVSNVLNKDSAANVVLRTALQKLFNKEKAKETTLTAQSAAASGADAAAKTADAAATGTATKAQWSFNAAMLANPAAIVIASIVALVAAVTYLVSSYGDATDKIKDMNDGMDETTKRIDLLKSRADFAAQMAAATGKSAEEIRQIRTKALHEEYETAKAEYQRQRELYENSNSKQREQMREALDAAKKLRDDAFDAELKQLKQNDVDRAAERYNAQKAAAERRKQAAAERRKQIADAEKQLQDERIALMGDGLEKELAANNLAFQRKIDAIKGNSKAENELRLAYEKERLQAANDIRQKYAVKEQELRLRELQVLLAADETDTELRLELLEQESEARKAALDKNKMSAEEYRIAVLEIETDIANKRKKTIQDSQKDQIETYSAEAKARVAMVENTALEIINSENSTNDQIRAARELLSNHDKNLRQIELNELEKKHAAGLISEQEYQNGVLAIQRAALEEQRDMYNSQVEQMQQLIEISLQFAGDMASEIFGAIGDSIQRQLDALDNLYTTDAEKAKDDANKKYLSEKELEERKLALKRKQAKLDKAQAAFEIGLNTAMAIMRIWADVPKADFGATTIALTAAASALGATQLAVALSKPLPQYAKGRKGGSGEYAMVGERGAEIMYVPEGASIIPHNKINRPDTWGAYGVPIPERPNISSQSLRDALTWTRTGGVSLDYERLGRAVGENVRIPETNAVSVNVDRSGIVVRHGRDTRTYLNTKYNATWN